MKALLNKPGAKLLALSLALAAQFASAATVPVERIMERVDHANRKAFATQLASVKITTCKYAIVDGGIRCADRPRVVVAENAKKGEQDGERYNDRSLLIVREPISDKGTSLLIYEYGDAGRDNDNWLYLPALGKVNRVIADSEGSGSVFGSEFSVENTENAQGRKLHEYAYRLLEETTVQGRAAWVVEIVPTGAKAAKTSYTKIVSWIDKETHLPLKEDLYRGGRIHKQRTQSELRQIDGVWVVTKVVMNNLSSSRVSQMDYLALRHNTEIPDEFLTQRSLTDFAYRERNLAAFREMLGK